MQWRSLWQVKQDQLWKQAKCSNLAGWSVGRGMLAKWKGPDLSLPTVSYRSSECLKWLAVVAQHPFSVFPHSLEFLIFIWHMVTQHKDFSIYLTARCGHKLGPMECKVKWYMQPWGYDLKRRGHIFPFPFSLLLTGIQLDSLKEPPQTMSWTGNRNHTC